MPEKLPPPELFESRTGALEQAIGDFDSVARVLPPDLRLRHSYCGISSESFVRFLRAEGYPARSMIRRRFEYNGDRTNHVIGIVEADDPLIFDATYSQFFQPFGLVEDYGFWPEEARIYPVEKVVTFRQSEVDTVAEWAAMVVQCFQRSHMDKRIHAHFRTEIGLQPQQPSTAELEAYFRDLWNLDTYTSFEPREMVDKYADIFAARLAAQN